MERFGYLILDKPLIKEEEKPDPFMNDFDEKKSILSINDSINDLSLIELLYRNSSSDNRAVYIMGFIILALDQILKKFKANTYSQIKDKFTLKKELLVRDYSLKLFFKTLNKKNQKKLSDKIQNIVNLYIKILEKDYDCHIIYDTCKKIENKHYFKGRLYDIFYCLEND